MPDEIDPDIELGLDDLELLREVVESLFREQHEAETVLRHLGWPPDAVPQFGSNYRAAWNDVFSQIRFGRVQCGYRRLLIYVLDQYPANAGLRAVAARHLPGTGRVAAEPVPPGGRDQLTLTSDVWHTYGRQLVGLSGADADGMLAVRSREQLARARAVLATTLTASDVPDVAIRRSIDLVDALDDALAAKGALAHLDVPRIALGRLQTIYFREVGAWPRDGESHDALLVSAALVSLAMRRRRRIEALSPLARYLLAVVVTCGAEPDHPAIAAWLQAHGHQVADAAKHSRLRASSKLVQLFIDLGPEPSAEPPGLEPDIVWPQSPTAILIPDGADPVSLPRADSAVRYEPSRQGLLGWMRETLHQARDACGPEDGVLVDLAAPHRLLDAGIENWPVVEIDGEFEPLADHCQPWLRWSQRHHVPALRRAVRARADGVVWADAPAFLPPTAAGDATAVKQWLAEHRTRPWLVYVRPELASHDLLKLLLRDGCPYIVRYERGMPAAQKRRIVAAARAVPPAARRAALPETIRRKSGAPPPSVVWDDQRGRDGHDIVLIRLRGPERLDR